MQIRQSDVRIDKCSQIELHLDRELSIHYHGNNEKNEFRETNKWRSARRHIS